MGVAEAAEDLRNWKLRADELDTERDPLVRAAHAAGISVQGISSISGLSRTTVYKILGMPEGRADE
jgi:hypothetical protein